MLLVHTSKTLDPATRLPIAIVDTTILQNALPSHEELVSNIELLPNCDHVLLCFASGVTKTPSVAWLQRAYRAIDQDTKKRIKRVYIVHGNWWAKTVLKVMHGLLSPKFSKKTVFLPSLSALAMHIDITLIDISTAVYLTNLEVEDHITIPKHPKPVFGMPLPPLPGHAWRSCIAYLIRLDNLSPQHFDLSRQDPEMLQILCDAIDRSQVLKLRDYGAETVLGVLRAMLMQLPDPLLPLFGTKHPPKHTLADAQEIVLPLSPAQGQHLALLLKWANKATTKSPELMAPLVRYFALPLFGVRAASSELVESCREATFNLITRYPELIADPVPGPVPVSESMAEYSPPLPPRSPRHAPSSPKLPPRRAISYESSKPREITVIPDLTPSTITIPDYSITGWPSGSPDGHLLRAVSPDAQLRLPIPPTPRQSNSRTQSPDRRSISDNSGMTRPLREVNSNMASPMPLAPPLVPASAPGLRSQASIRNIRGEKVAQLALHFEPDAPSEDSPFK